MNLEGKASGIPEFYYSYKVTVKAQQDPNQPAKPNSSMELTVNHVAIGGLPLIVFILIFGMNSCLLKFTAELCQSIISGDI